MHSYPESVTFSSPALFDYQPIGNLEVRPILASEQKQWDKLVQNHHYLGLRAIVDKRVVSWQAEL